MRQLLALAIVVVPLLVAAVPAGAQSPRNPRVSDPDAQRKRDAAVTVCVSTVRKERSAPKFDAYATGGQVRVYGNPEERLDFDRCMAQQGQPSR